MSYVFVHDVGYFFQGTGRHALPVIFPAPAEPLVPGKY